MSAWTQDDYVKSEFSLGGITLDDIMNDYYGRSGASEPEHTQEDTISAYAGLMFTEVPSSSDYYTDSPSRTPGYEQPAPKNYTAEYHSVSELSDYSYPPEESYRSPKREESAFYSGGYEPEYSPPPPEPEVPAPEPRRRARVSAMEDEAKSVFKRLSEDDYARLVAEEEATAAREASVDIDPRFNVNGKYRRRAMSYNGNEVDMDHDPEYSPNDQRFAVPSEYNGDPEDDNHYFVDEQAQPRSIFSSGKKKRSTAPKLDEAERIPDYAEEDLRYRKSAQTASGAKKSAKKSAPSYTDEYDEYIYDEEEKRRRYNESLRQAQDEENDFVDSFRDYRDGYDDDGYDSYNEEFEGEFPGSFGEFLRNELIGILYRMRGSFSTKPVNATAEDEEEDLGAEVSAKAASKYYGSFIPSLRLRFRFSLGVMVAMIWMSTGLPKPGMLNDVRVASAMLLACQLNMMLLALDSVTGTVMKLFRLKFGADALVLLSCIVTSVDAVLVCRTHIVTPHLPLCVLSSLSLLGVMFSSLLSARGMRKAIRVPAIAKRIYTVTGETNVTDSDVTLLKSVRSYKGFVRRCEEAPPDETLFMKLSPFILIISLFFSAIVVVAKGHGSDFIYVFSAVLAPAVPFSALICFALPYFIGSDRIFDSGAAIAGWSGLCDIGASHNLIVTDRDLFPDGSVDIEGIRIFADESSEKVIAYAGSMLTAAGSSVSHCFADVMERNNCSMRHVENFKYLSGGGMEGIIDGDHVLCGSTDLMRLMKVRIPYKLVDKCSVLLAINGVLYGIFNMKYTGQAQVRYALTSLMRSNRHPIFAIRDFNVTPEMIHNTFDVPTDGYDFPPYVERFAISDAAPSEGSKVAAVVCREGLAPLTHMADTGRSMYMAVRINLAVTVIGIVLTLLTVFFKLIISGTVGPTFLIILMLAWVLPVICVSVFMRS